MYTIELDDVSVIILTINANLETNLTGESKIFGDRNVRETQLAYQTSIFNISGRKLLSDI